MTAEDPLPKDEELTEAQRAELDRRLEDLDRDLRLGRSLGIPWEEVLRRIRDGDHDWRHRWS